jgi:hypothetical protein
MAFEEKGGANTINPLTRMSRSTAVFRKVVQA